MIKHKTNLQFGKYTFTPSWLISSLTFILFALFITLGCWQLHRFEEKKILLKNYQARAQLKPLFLADVNTTKPLNFQYYPLQLQGHYDNTHTLLLDNRIYQHRLGYHVLTPFITNTQDIILINRGWIARNADRQVLPVIPSAIATHIIGVIYVPPPKTFVLSNRPENLGWPRIIQAIDFPQLEQWLSHSMHPWVLQLSPQLPDGFAREWQPQVTPQKNLSYALQWFTFAAVLLVLFIILNIHRYEK